MNYKLNVITVQPQSKMVELLEYDYPRRILKITIRKGVVFKKKKVLEDISYNEFIALIEAESVGKAVLAKIKKKNYQYA